MSEVLIKRTTDGRITLSTVVMAAIAIGCFALGASSPQLAAIGGPYGMLPPVIPRTPFNPRVPVFVPTDVTSPNVQLSVPALFALSGIQQLPNNQFPKDDELKGSSEWILVRSRPVAAYDRPSVHPVTLKQGDILRDSQTPVQSGNRDNSLRQSFNCIRWRCRSHVQQRCFEGAKP